MSLFLNKKQNIFAKFTNYPKSVIRFFQCCMAVKNPLFFPIWKGMPALFLKTVPDKGYACLFQIGWC